jgi:acetate kinase
LAAIDGGKSVDTSMGFTPLAGVMMGTRTGELDASLIPYIMAKAGITDVAEIIDIFNKKSGLVGISEISSDMRDIISAYKAGDEKGHSSFRHVYQPTSKIYRSILSCSKWCRRPYFYSRYR